MRRIWAFVGLCSAVLATSLVHAQGGQNGFGGGGFGGGGFGGGAGGPGGVQQENYDNSTQAIESTIASYLDTKEIKNILTPGEYSEWKLDLKAGQVVIAEARSDAFDPALEVVDVKAKVLASNDDRYPGDQRPLLIWHCDTDGSYAIRGRCFHDKSGGQFFLKFKIYDSFDVSTDKISEIKEPTSDNYPVYLLRMQLKGGHIYQAFQDIRDWQKEKITDLRTVISPTGLPDIRLAEPISAVLHSAVIAPVDGDYYVMAFGQSQDARVVRVGLREIVPSGLEGSAKGTPGTPQLLKLKVKKGELLDVTVDDAFPNAMVLFTEEPDTSKYDLSKPETNPFFPVVKKEEKLPTFETLPGRGRDMRRTVISVNKDATLWVATLRPGNPPKPYTINVRPAAQDFKEAAAQSDHLKIGNNDYWAFDSKVGDVMTFKFTAKGFAEQVVIRDPNHQVVWSSQAVPDQELMKGSMITRIPGRYVVAVSSIGDGGGGEYSLQRTSYSAKEFKKGVAASGEIATEQTQVWKFKATPDQPLLIHWSSPTWNYSIQVKDENGVDVNLPFYGVSNTDRYAILKVDKPTEYMIVLSGYEGSKSTYAIELNDLPGLGKGR